MDADEITGLEVEAIRKTNVSDWPGARAFFHRALALEMTPLRRAEIMRNLAGTYWKEGDSRQAHTVAKQAINILDSADVSGERAEDLRGELQNILSFTGGNLPVRTFWYVVFFLGGLYWGLSFASGAPMDLVFVILAPPLLCLVSACAAVGTIRVNAHVRLGAVTLYTDFILGFGIGYFVAASGIIRFAGYGPR